MRSIHDNHVFAYTVNCEERQLILHTRTGNADDSELTDVVFAGVIAHHFENVLNHNILFDITEVDPDDIVTAEADRFSESWKWNWPPVDYRGNLSTLKQLLREQGIRGFKISSSYGLSGWVLANDCERRTAM
ncbi:MAG TPA: hypothetical protein VG711_03180 [Phycisphaerales bacterium]|nr:hypothetical protein [Phycisphaerales bacterium]